VAFSEVYHLLDVSSKRWLLRCQGANQFPISSPWLQHHHQVQQNAIALFVTIAAVSSGPTRNATFYKETLPSSLFETRLGLLLLIGLWNGTYRRLPPIVSTDANPGANVLEA